MRPSNGWKEMIIDGPNAECRMPNAEEEEEEEEEESVCIIMVVLTVHCNIRWLNEESSIVLFTDNGNRSKGSSRIR